MWELPGSSQQNISSRKLHQSQKICHTKTGNNEAQYNTYAAFSATVCYNGHAQWYSMYSAFKLHNAIVQIITKTLFFNLLALSVMTMFNTLQKLYAVQSVTAVHYTVHQIL